MECSEKQIFNQIKQNWDSIAKPLDSLGKLEEIVCRIGAVQKSVHPDVSKSAVLVLCADNGVVAEGISQSDQSVTRICAENIAAGKTTVGIMAAQSGTDVIAVDMGMNCGSVPGVLDRKIRRGTRNFAVEPAMTPAEAKKGIETGTQLVKELAEKGYKILCIGEMGIGNTTTSAAVAAALLKLPAAEVTGRGAGLDDAGLAKKIRVIQDALTRYGLFDADVMTVLQSVGGFDIAGMTGVYLGAKKYGIPVVLDGAISMVAALLAERLVPGTVEYLIPSHKSREPLVEKVCEALNINPVLDAGMALGEGTGAVLMMGVIKTAAAVYEKSVPFKDSGVGQYVRFDKEKSDGHKDSGDGESAKTEK